MSSPTPIDLYGTAGSTLVVDLVLTRGNNPVNLTGATVWMTLKRRYADPDPGVAQVSTASGIVVTDLPGGLATAMFDETATDDFVASGITLVYDVKVKESSGVESTPISGQVYLKPAATRAS